MVFLADQPIHDVAYCLQANNCQLLHMQHQHTVCEFRKHN